MPASIEFFVDRSIPGLVDGKPVSIPQGLVLKGTVDFSLSDGPMKQREWENPSWLESEFRFEFEGRRYIHRGSVSHFALWAPRGIQTIARPANFCSAAGTLDGMVDGRDDWFYLKPDGSRHANRLKYTGFHVDIMPAKNELVVQCRYYDQNPEISGYVTIYYPLRYPMVVLRNDHVLSKDASGAVEEVLANEGAHVTLMQDT